MSKTIEQDENGVIFHYENGFLVQIENPNHVSEIVISPKLGRYIDSVNLNNPCQKPLTGVKSIKVEMFPLQSFSVANNMLPDIESMEFKNNTYYFDENQKALYSKNKLRLYNVFSKDCGTFILDDETTYISNFAFSGTNYEDIVFPNPKNTKYSRLSFAKSKFLLQHEKGYFIRDNVLMVLTDVVNIPYLDLNQFEKINECSTSDKIRININTAVIHNGIHMGILLDYIDSIEKLIIHPWTDNIYSRNLSKKNLLLLSDHCHVSEFDINTTEFVSSGGIVYSSDLKELILYPSGKQDEEFLIPEGTEIIGNKAFWKARNLKKLVMADSIHTIGEYAFAYSGIYNFKISSSITLIESYTFAYCQNMQKIAIPGNVEYISANAFYWCKNLTEIELNDGIQCIYGPAFPSSVHEIHLPKSVKYLSDLSLQCCKDVYIESPNVYNLILALGHKQFSYIHALWNNEIYMIPPYDNASFGNSYLNRSWNTKCFEKAYESIPDMLNRNETKWFSFVLFNYLRKPEKYKQYKEDIRKKILSEITFLIESNRMEEVTKIINTDLLTQDMLLKCRDLAEKNENTILLSYIVNKIYQENSVFEQNLLEQFSI